MFERNQLANLPYPIPPNDVHLYEDDEGTARHPLFISRKLYP